MRKENRQLRVEREYWQKPRPGSHGRAIRFPRSLQVREVNQADYPITTMCRLLGVSTSGYYAWVDRGPSTRDEANARLLETINGIHSKVVGPMELPALRPELREEGLLVGKNGWPD